MAPSLRPTRIIVDVDAQQLVITWADRHESIYPLDGLRRACPCVTCRGSHAEMGAPADPSVLQEAPRRRWEDVQVQPVGGYGLRMTWDDGHDDGVYTWQRLRDLAPATP